VSRIAAPALSPGEPASGDNPMLRQMAPRSALTNWVPCRTSRSRSERSWIALAALPSSTLQSACSALRPPRRSPRPRRRRSSGSAQTVYVNRWNEPHVVPETADRTSPIARRSARFHRHYGGRLFSQEAEQQRPRYVLAQYRPSVLRRHMDLEHSLCQVDPNNRSFLHGCFSSRAGYATPPAWHTSMPSGGGIHPIKTPIMLRPSACSPCADDEATVDVVSMAAIIRSFNFVWRRRAQLRRQLSFCPVAVSTVIAQPPLD
jgi:hypothetical protein